MTGAIPSSGSSTGFVKVAVAGLVTGVLTPLLQPVLDSVTSSPGDIRIALLALPFAILVLVLVRRLSSNPWWAALAAALITMIAFVCAVNAAIWIDGQLSEQGKWLRSIVAGIAGGLTGSAVMALGLSLLPSGPRGLPAWMPMLMIGTASGPLLALDNALELDLLSILYPVWQAGVAIGLAAALQRAGTS